MEWNGLAVYGFVTLSMGDLVFGVSVDGFLFFFCEGGIDVFKGIFNGWHGYFKFIFECFH
jgi:hypothetical protein